MRFPRPFRRLLLAAVIAGAGVAAPDAADAQTTLGRIREEGKVRIAIAGEAPYGYRNAEGEVTGEAPEIARVVLNRIDPAVEIEWVETEFGNLIPGLQAGDFDIAAAGMFITPERCEEVAFSDPTYVIGEALAVRKGNPKGLTDFETISARNDAKVGLIAGTVEYNYALVTGIPGDRALLYSNFDKAIEALKEGEVDAVALTSLTAKDLVEGEPDLEATSQFYPMLDGVEVKGYGGFAFRREDEALRQAFNQQLDSFLASDEHWSLVEPFGFTPEMAPEMTAQVLCAD
ncbi:MAG TPA: ectoine/hydroxyectoine ABC transporter substrate-binding protein EhuB [Geminicoccaceae bacterium]